MMDDAVMPEDRLHDDTCILSLYRQRIMWPGRICLCIGPMADEQEG
jgi:hypothetical protein